MGPCARSYGRYKLGYSHVDGCPTNLEKQLMTVQRARQVPHGMQSRETLRLNMS